MKRAVNIVLILLLAIIVASSVGLYAYRAELVWLVVKNDMVQKAPDGYPPSKIYAAFEQERHHLRTGALRKDVLLERLFAISRQLEKTQYLTPAKLDQMLQTLAGQRAVTSEGQGTARSEAEDAE